MSKEKKGFKNKIFSYIKNNSKKKIIEKIKNLEKEDIK